MPKWLTDVRWNWVLSRVIRRARRSGAEVRSFDTLDIPDDAPVPERVVDSKSVELLERLAETLADESGAVAVSAVIDRDWEVAVLQDDGATEDECAALAEWLAQHGVASVVVVLTDWGVPMSTPRPAAVQAGREVRFWQTGSSHSHLLGIPLIPEQIGDYLVTTEDGLFALAMTHEDFHVIAGPPPLVRAVAGCEPEEANSRILALAARDDWYSHLADVVARYTGV